MNRKIFTIIILAAMVFFLGATANAYGLIPVETLVPGELDVAAFLPLLAKNLSASGGVNGVLVVFSTEADTNGAGGGRAGMNAICIQENPDSHFCTLPEIENAMMTGGVRFSNPFNEAWVDNPGLGTVVTNQVDGTFHESKWRQGNCIGWSSDAHEAGGVMILEDAEGVSTEASSGLALCNQTRRVACCRWTP